MSNLNLVLLRAIANATAANSVVYVTQADGMPLMQHNPPLISVDPTQADPTDANKRAAKVTDAGVAMLANEGHSQNKPIAQYSIQSGGLELPKVKRVGGGAGAPVKYPFDTMAVNDYFFVPNADAAKGNAVKTMNSAVGSANQRYAEDVVENGVVKMKTVTRAKRGEDNKAIKGADGKNITETVSLPEKHFTRKFVVRAVEAGKVYGAFTAPADGAVVARIS